MIDASSLVLCTGSLGAVSLDDKFRAAAAAGFGWVSLYGVEYHAAVDAGCDLLALKRELGIGVAEVDGVAVSMQSDDAFAEALDIARAVEARSITIVETGDYNPDDPAQVRAAIDAFGRHCDRAADFGILVHLEPFAWSSLSRTSDCATIIGEAARPNGGLLLDLWHLVRGPDQGHVDPGLESASVFEVQLGDTLSMPWSNVRDECMDHRVIPGRGHGGLATRLADLAAAAPLPLVGVELFGKATQGQPPEEMAPTLLRSLQDVAVAAGVWT